MEKKKGGMPGPVFSRGLAAAGRIFPGLFVVLLLSVVLSCRSKPAAEKSNPGVEPTNPAAATSGGGQPAAPATAEAPARGVKGSLVLLYSTAVSGELETCG